MYVIGTIVWSGHVSCELRPAVERLVEVGHVGHRAAGAQVREDHADVLVGEDVGALGHEVDAAEDDVLDALLVGGLAGELEAVAGEVGEVDDRVLLVVVAEDRRAACPALPWPTRCAGAARRR